jgi:preprotein translocase subunit YajC
MQTLIFLQAPGGNAGMIQMLFFAAIILVFWLFINRKPSARKSKTPSPTALKKGWML